MDTMCALTNLMGISLVNIILALVRISILQKKNSVFGHAQLRKTAGCPC